LLICAKYWHTLPTTTSILPTNTIVWLVQTPDICKSFNKQINKMQQNIITSLTPDELRQIVVESVEHVLKSQKQQESALPARRSMTVDEAAAYTGLCKQSVYIKTSRNEIPHSKRGKRLFFDCSEIDAWLLENRRATTTEAEKQADNFLASSAARRTR